MTEPIILSGTTDTGTRYVQFWTEHERIAGRDVAYCRATMCDGDVYAPDRLRITRECPLLWVERVLELFPGFLTGGDVAATHTVSWRFGVPTFTPVTVVADGGLLDLLEAGA